MSASGADSLQQFDRVTAIEGFPVSQARFRRNTRRNRQLLHRAVAQAVSWKTTALGQERTCAERKISSVMGRVLALLSGQD